MDKAQQQLRLLIGNLTVENVLLGAKVEELEARIAQMTKDLIEAGGVKAGKKEQG